MKKKMILALSAVVFVSCDWQYGLTRTVTLSGQADPVCISHGFDNLSSHNKIIEYSVERKKASKSYHLFRGTKELPAQDVYKFHTSKMTGFLSIEKPINKPQKVVIDVTVIGSGMSEEEYNYRQSILEEIYSEMRKECGTDIFPEPSIAKDKIFEGK